MIKFLSFSALIGVFSSTEVIHSVHEQLTQTTIAIGPAHSDPDEIEVDRLVLDHATQIGGQLLTDNINQLPKLRRPKFTVFLFIYQMIVIFLSIIFASIV